MAIANLSLGCMDQIMTGNDVDKPVLQILGTKKISGSTEGSERYRLLVSDGKYFNSFAMLATQLNGLHGEGKLTENTIIRLDRYITSMVNKSDKGEKRVLIILDLTVLNPGSEVGKKIGNPTPFTGESTSTVNKTAPTNMAANNSKQSKVGSNAKENMLSYSNTSLNQSLNSGLTVPINSLSPYQNKWVIKARVTSKSTIRQWNNAKGEGKLFSMDLMDESGEIRATAFKEMVDKYYNIIEVDKIYFISKCQLKPANKQYTNLNNDYEMTFTNDTLVQPCEDDETDIPQVQYNLIKIEEVADKEANNTVDVIGVCRDIGELQIFTGKTNNREFKKRELTLIDTSNIAVQLVLWGDEAVNFEGHVQPVVLVKNARVTEFGGGKSLSIGNGSVFKINPDIPEGHRLRGWFDNGGGAGVATNVSSRITGAGGSFNADFMTFNEVRAKNLGTGDKPDYFQTKAVINIIRSTNAVYKACPQQECNKKVIEEMNGHYRCEKCNTVYPNFKYRLLVNMSIADWTSNRWVTCFSDISENMLGKTSQEIGEALERSPECADELFSVANFKSFIFKLRTKMEMYGDMQRSKITVMSATPINYKEYNKYMISALQQLTGIGKN